jgi:FkbM family methyltransferase
MSNTIRKYLQKVLGFNYYLFISSVFKIITLRFDRKENDFFYFLRLLPENAIVLDIGANIGIMSVHLCRRVKKGMVYAFEPIPENYLALQKIARFFKVQNLLTFNCALGDQNKVIEMIMPVNALVKKEGLGHVVYENMNDLDDGIRYSVLQRTLDSIAAEIKMPFYAIKMDAENFEFYILKGGTESIAKYRPIIYCKLWDNENRRRCFVILIELGYHIMVLDNKKLVDYDSLVHRTQHFFFVPWNVTFVHSA